MEAIDVFGVGSMVAWSRRLGRWVRVGGCFGIVVVAEAVGGANFQGLGDLPDGAISSQALGVSGNGAVVVGTGSSGPGLEAFRWTADGGMVGLGDFSGGVFQSQALGVSGNGAVVVGSGNGHMGVEAFRWGSGGMLGLGGLAGGAFGLVAQGANGDGSVVVGKTNLNEAFRWTAAGGLVGLGDLFGMGIVIFSEAYGVSGDGQVVVGQGFSTSGQEAFRWTSGGGMVGLGDLADGGFESKALGVNGDGSVVVGYGISGSGVEAFRCEGGVMTGLGDLAGGGFGSRALGVSGDGAIVVGKGTTLDPMSMMDRDEAFIWDGVNGMRNLRSVLVDDFDLGAALTGWTLGEARAISADGTTVVGTGINPMGQTEAWAARLGAGIAAAGATVTSPLLPGTVDGDGFHFKLGVNDVDWYYIDPTTAVGYEYVVEAGPKVRAVVLPAVGDGLFDVFVFDGMGDLVLAADDLAAGVAFDFGVMGVDRFRVEGIEASAGLDADDPLAFVTGLTFVGVGEVVVTQKAIVLPEVSTGAVVLAAGVMTGLRRRRR